MEPTCLAGYVLYVGKYTAECLTQAQAHELAVAMIVTLTIGCAFTVFILAAMVVHLRIIGITKGSK